ncbi:IS66 family transposase [Escherichia coli]|uniref:IS66 family transposase n=1 Tax=Escherichia coli TaxID=562 RepID=UPI00192098A6
MDTSLAHENARLRALLQTQQDTIRQMAEYNRLLSQRVAAYASEINRLKALVAKLQRMQFGKSSEKLRAKTERQIQEAQERISALQEEMAETLGEQYDPVLPSALRQSSARKPLPASLPRETRVIRPEEECCPACGGELSSLGCDVSEQLELISSAFKVIETQRPKLACCRCDHIVQAPVPSKPIARSYAGAGLLAHVVTGKYADHLPLYRQSEIYRRQGVELSRATLGRWTGAVAELLEPLYDVLRQYVLMPGKVHADDIPVPVQDALNVYCSNGWVEIDNNIAENALRGVAVGRKNWMFAGSDSGGEHAAVLYSLIGTCRLNNVEPEKWLRYVIEHIQDWPANRVRDLLPWKVDLSSQ